MSQQDDLTAVQRRLDELVNRVGELEQTVEQLRHGPPSPAATPRPPDRSGLPDLVHIPDTPYNSALWTDSDDEGLGLRDRHAP
ncbi:hypothetical protein NLX86_22430 [Streptomyces sp. A3M-1-3]|uniref:hypothetical protein n=1 Tax=Streptomyces sp. A3M-1-3 TaxID=2962044 RepID=UPI0020B6C5D1|nr:hypothetical protein [Streptomyces sp. A3M-1-3]MCP3820750.1 hypothetical protein [Streptomyces sp. A3M-1-3]